MLYAAVVLRLCRALCVCSCGYSSVFLFSSFTLDQCSVGLVCCCVDVAVLLCCCVAVLLCCCVAVLLCCCVAVLLCCCVAVLLCFPVFFQCVADILFFFAVGSLLSLQLFIQSVCGCRI